MFNSKFDLKYSFIIRIQKETNLRAKKISDSGVGSALIGYLLSY